MKELLIKFIREGTFVRGEVLDGVEIFYGLPKYLKELPLYDIEMYAKTISIFDNFLETSGLRELCRRCHRCCPNCRDYELNPLLCKNPTCVFYLCENTISVGYYSPKDYRPGIIHLLLNEHEKALVNLIRHELKESVSTMRKNAPNLLPERLLDYFDEKLKDLSKPIKEKIMDYKILFGVERFPRE